MSGRRRYGAHRRRGRAFSPVPNAAQARKAQQAVEVVLELYADQDRHLVCVPYSRTNLRRAAAMLNIGEHWLHGGTFPHVDIPVRQVARVLADPRVTTVSSRRILAIIKAGQ